MKRVLSSVGIGSATVDTVLPDGSFVPGETVEATVEVEGGSSEQEIEQLNFAFVTRYRGEEGYEQSVFERFGVAEPFTIGAGDRREIPIEFTVPYGTPLTKGGVTVWLKTGLDIDWALDPTDKDHVEVQPDERMAALFEAVEDLGFGFHSSEVERTRFGHSHPFAQEFEFRPRSGPFARDLDELELVCAPTADAVQVHLEIDRRGGLLSEMADTDESRDDFRFDGTDTDSIRSELRRRIEHHV
jgi:sporulation-control protein